MGGVIALDIATTTGFGISTPEMAGIVYGSKRMGGRGASPGESFVALRDWMEEQIEMYRPAIMIMETPLLITRGGLQTAQKLMGMAGVADELATRRGLKTFQAESSTVTKHFTGHGRWPSRNDKKAAVIKMCQLRGWAPHDDNAADALALLDYALATLNLKFAVDRVSGPLFGRK